MKKVTGDPHFAFAFTMLNIAWSRIHSSARIVWPEADADDVFAAPPPSSRPVVPLIEQVHSQIPMVAQLGEELDDHMAGRCGGCDDFLADRSWCNYRGFNVGPQDPGCEDYYEKR